MCLSHRQTIPPHLPPTAEKLIPQNWSLGTKRVGQYRLITGQVMKVGDKMGAKPTDLHAYSDETKDFPTPSLDKVLCTTTDPTPKAVTLVCVGTSSLKMGQDLGVKSLVLGASTHILIKSSFECGAGKLNSVTFCFNSLQAFAFTVPKLEFQEISL